MSGGLEDWAYAASWESKFNDKIIQKCDGLPDIETQYDSQSIRSMTYLVETAISKSPSAAYLGASEALDVVADKYAYGYVPININLCLSLIDILEPYVK